MPQICRSHWPIEVGGADRHVIDRESDAVLLRHICIDAARVLHLRRLRRINGIEESDVRNSVQPLSHARRAWVPSVGQILHSKSRLNRGARYFAAILPPVAAEVSNC